MSHAEPSKRLNTKQGLRSKAYRAIVQLLTEDPGLVEHVDNWRTRAGADEEMEVPTFGMLPMIALSPRPMADTVLTGEHSKVNFVVAVEVWAPGSCVDDLTDIWDLVCEALRMEKAYREGTVYSFLRCGIPGLSIPYLSVSEPAYFPWLPSDALKRQGDPGMQWGLGTIAFFFQRPR